MYIHIRHPIQLTLKSYIKLSLNAENCSEYTVYSELIAYTFI